MGHGFYCCHFDTFPKLLLEILNYVIPEHKEHIVYPIGCMLPFVQYPPSLFNIELYYVVLSIGSKSRSSSLYH
jgi:hypothetical protein